MSVPLLQRLRFLGIYSNNQDESVRVRLANLLRMGVSILDPRVRKIVKGVFDLQRADNGIVHRFACRAGRLDSQLGKVFG